MLTSPLIYRVGLPQARSSSEFAAIVASSGLPFRMTRTSVSIPSRVYAQAVSQMSALARVRRPHLRHTLFVTLILIFD
jgi:hypothetical protein